MDSVGQGISISEPCSTCGAAADVEVGQRLIEDELRWSISVRCDACGAAIEADADGEGMERLRRRMLEEAPFTLDADGVSVVHLMKALREGRRLSLAAAKAEARSIAEGSWRGTRPEAAQLARRVPGLRVRACVE